MCVSRCNSCKDDTSKNHNKHSKQYVNNDWCFLMLDCSADNQGN